MDRREFLKTTGAAAAAATAVTTAASDAAATTLASPAVAKGLRELRLAMPWEESSAGAADWARRLARGITQMSGGRYRVAPEFAVAEPIDAVRAGEADLYFGALDHDTHRGLAFFAGLPGDLGISPEKLQAWVSVGGGQALWDDLAADLGIKPLLAAHTGSQSYLMATELVESMGALPGRKAQLHGLAREVGRGLGLEPVSLAPGQIADAMRRGQVLAAECGGAIVSYALQLPRVAPYAAGTSINRYGTALTLGVCRSLWADLGATEQAMFAAAAASEFQLSLAEEEAHRHLLHPAAPAERTWPLAGELEHAIRRISDAVVAHAAGTDAKARRVSDSYATFQRAIGTREAIA